MLRAIRALRRGAGRELTLRDVRLGMERAGERFGENAAVLEEVGHALDPWLRAAGFKRIQGPSELDCP